MNINGQTMTDLNGRDMASLSSTLNFSDQQKIEAGLDSPTFDLRLEGNCLWCDEPRMITLSIQTYARYGSSEALANWIDTQAGYRCDCLNSVLFGIGHRASQRKAVRLALEDAKLDGLDDDPEYADYMLALRAKWLELQPKSH